MTNLTDPIERLRAERPDADSDPSLAAPSFATTAPRPARRAPRRRRLQLGIAAAIASALVLTGAITLRPSEHGAARITPGISVAEAKAQAIDALSSVSELQAYTYALTWSVTSDDGRSYEYSTTRSRDGDNSHLTR